ncbi:CRISPR-associated endonuclease Cas2 [Xylocopilactobacillus apicola]|nr:CRISPR-associated endonuclease Cas2 [Xylocopilactobacillus apicola]
MRLLIFFDVPTLTAEDRRNYRKLHQTLVKEGFLMIQESVYVRVLMNKQSANFLEERIQKVAPVRGTVQSMIVTEKQYSEIKFLAGKNIEDVRNSDERMVVI